MNLNGVTTYTGIQKIKGLVLPGFDGVPISHVITFFIKGLRKGVLVTRASSIAFNLLMALLPASIFLFTLIPFIPIPNFQEEVLKLFENFLPSNAFNFLETSIIDIVTHKSGGLLLIMLIVTIIFSTNGIHAVIHAFVVSAHSFKTRSWINQRKISIVLLIIVVMMISTAGFLVIFGKIALNRLVELEFIKRNLVIYILIFLKWIMIILLLFFAISSLYYLAPAKRTDFRFFSPGSTLATILFILTSLGFSAYVNNYGPYNKLYGSIGTLMVILVWLYLNSIAILIGFELNVSIISARVEDEMLIHPVSHNEETRSL
jgi:membrane protein